MPLPKKESSGKDTMANRKYKMAKTLVLTASCMTATSAIAQNDEVNARFDRLEGLVNMLAKRLDRQEKTVSQEDAAIARQAQQAVQETSTGVDGGHKLGSRSMESNYCGGSQFTIIYPPDG